MAYKHEPMQVRTYTSTFLLILIEVLCPQNKAFFDNFKALWTSLRWPHLGSLNKPILFIYH